MWDSTVRTETWSRSAICRLVRPSPARWATSRSRALRAMGEWASRRAGVRASSELPARAWARASASAARTQASVGAGDGGGLACGVGGFESHAGFFEAGGDGEQAFGVVGGEGGRRGRRRGGSGGCRGGGRVRPGAVPDRGRRGGRRSGAGGPRRRAGRGCGCGWRRGDSARRRRGCCRLRLRPRRGRGRTRSRSSAAAGAGGPRRRRGPRGPQRRRPSMPWLCAIAVVSQLPQPPPWPVKIGQGALERPDRGPWQAGAERHAPLEHRHPDRRLGARESLTHSSRGPASSGRPARSASRISANPRLAAIAAISGLRTAVAMPRSTISAIGPPVPDSARP